MKSVRHHQIVVSAWGVRSSPRFFHILRSGRAYTINTFAGGGLPENVPGESASLGSISAMAVASAGNVLIGSVSYRAVLRWDVGTNLLTVVAGTGAPGSGGDGGPATSAQIAYPAYIATDAAGDIYISDIETEPSEGSRRPGR